MHVLGLWPRFRRQIHRLLHWEYWPSWAFYLPVVPLWVLKAIQHRSVFYFTQVNPAIRNGGMYHVSKMQIYQLLPSHSYPKTILIQGGTTEQLLQNVQKNGFTYPLIVKPDLGLRGIQVRVIHYEQELTAYHRSASYNYLVQEIIPYENEVAIFYIRHPRQAQGHITGITGKEFMSVTGNGQHTLRELLAQTPRYAMQIERLAARQNLEAIPQHGEHIRLEPIGNHNLGTMFLDWSHRASPALIEVIDSLCCQIPGFFYGRLDIRFRTWEELEQGRHFSIIELNGALSEPTHAYDPQHSFWHAIRELYRHHAQLLDIGAYNHRQSPCSRTFRENLRELRSHFRKVRLLKCQFESGL